MASFSKRISTFCLGLLTALLLGCGGEAQGEIETGTDFSMAVATTEYTLAPGAIAFTPIDVAWVGCPPRDVLFELQGLPPGVTPTFSSNPHPTATRLQLNLSQTMAAGTYDLLLRGSSGTLVHTRALRLVVSAAAPGFSVTITPATLQMDAAINGAATIQITRTPGFTAPVSVVTDPPPGFIVEPSSASPSATPSAVAGDTIKLTVKGGAASPGAYAIGVQVSAGGQLVEKSLPVNLKPCNFRPLNAPKSESYRVFAAFC